MVHQAIHGGHRHGLVREHLVPRRERRVGGDGDALCARSARRSVRTAPKFRPGRDGRSSDRPGSAGRSDRACASSAGSRRSRRAACRRCTNSLVRMKSTRWPRSISAWPMPATRCVLPTPGGPKASRLWPCASQLSASASAMTCALEIAGTAEKSNCARLLPGGRWLSARARASRRGSRVRAFRGRSRQPRKRSAGQPSRLDCSARSDHSRFIVGRRSSVSMSGSRAASAALCVAARSCCLQQFVIHGCGRQHDLHQSASARARGANRSRSARCQAARRARAAQPSTPASSATTLARSARSSRSTISRHARARSVARSGAARSGRTRCAGTSRRAAPIGQRRRACA